MKTEFYYKFIYSKLEFFNRKEALFQLLKGLFLYIILCLPVVVVLLFSENIFSFSSKIRLALLFLFFTTSALFIGFILFRYLIKNVLFKNNVVFVARSVGQFYSDIKDNLANALQVYKNQQNIENYSSALREASLQKSYEEIKEKSFTKNIKWKQFNRLCRIILIEIVLVIVLLILPTNLFDSFTHFLHPLEDYSSTALYSIGVHPGDISVVKGNDVTIKAWSDVPNISAISFCSNKKLFENVIMQKVNNDTFKHVLPSVTDSMTYYVKTRDLKTQVYKISVLELPLIRRLQLKIIPPTYSRQEAYLMPENIGDISALKGSTVEILGEPNKPVEKASVVFSYGKKISLNKKGLRISGEFTVTKKGSYYFILTDQDSLNSENPVEYFINVLHDQFPFVNLSSPGMDIDLGENMILPIAIEASDDYGISRMRLAYQLIPEGLGEIDSTRFIYQELSGFSKGLDQINLAFNWDLKSSEMMPTDVIVYFVEVFDTDNISGPKRSQTHMFRARFPSMYELYEELAGNQDETIDSMENVYEKSLEIKEKLEKMSLELRRAKEIDWQQQQEIEDAVKAQKEMQEEIENLSDKLDEMISNMEKNDLVSNETLKKYEELQELVNEIMSPELKEIMEKVQEAMQDLDQNLVKKALDDLKLSQEEFNKSLDRSIELLKRLRVEQKLDLAAKMAEDLLERQQQLGEKMNAENSQEKDLESKQEKINKDVEELSSALKELSKEMQDMPGAPQEQVSQAQSQLSDSDFEEQLDELQKSLKNENLSKAQNLSQKAKDQMQSVSQQLQQAKDSMSGAMQMRMMQAMKQATRDLLQLSKQQEELLKETADTPANSAKVNELAEKQNNLSSALNRSIDQMFSASKENVFMGSKIGQSLGKAASSMKQSLQQLSENSPQKAGPKQGESMSALNDAFKALQQSIEQMNQGSGSGDMSMEQFLKQMQQMGKQQQGINQQTQNLGLGQQQSLARQAAMARLAAEQQYVRKSAEQLSKEAGEMDDILGDMEKIVDDMKGVEKDFYQNNLSRETIERQNQILSRMLDAQKSMREREYTNKREAETGQAYIAENPNALPKSLGESKSQLQQDLLKAKKEGYTKDYLDLIRKYFQVLSEQDEYKN